MIARLLAATGVSAAISLAGRRAEALTTDGALAAWAVGTAIVAGSSWRGATVLGTFFVTSSALSRRMDRGEPLDARQSRRDARQVLANGGVAGIAALATLRQGDGWAFAALAGSLSAATADTWATEIGATSPRAPRLLLSRREAAVGTSGGVTARGLGASIAGAATIGLVSLLVSPGRRPRRAVAATLAGVGGSLLDSLLGEKFQEQRYCATCDVATESVIHRCGARSVRVAGVPGLDNDAVNLITTIAGAALAAALAGRSPGQFAAMMKP